MNDFSFYSPTKFIFGRQAELKTADCIKNFGGNKVLIHYGGGSAVRSGLLDRVRDTLRKQSINFVELGGVQPNPRSGLVYEGIKLCKDKKIDFILPVGGGSTIDSAKAIALGALYKGDFWDFYSGKAQIKKALPLGVILTIAAAGSEASDSSVITLEEGMFKRACSSDIIRPKFAIMNPELTFTLPPYQTASGSVDIMAHVIERYFTRTENVETTDRLCEALLLTMINEVPKVMKNPNDYDARANIMWAGTLAHNNVCGVDRAQDWASHAMEHELSGLYDCAHGAGLAVIIPAWMKYVMDNDVDRFYKYAVRVWGCEPSDDKKAVALEGISRTKAFFKSIGMPVTFGEIGAKAEDIDLLTEKVAYRPNGTIGGFVPLTKKDVKAIYESAAF